MHYYNFSVLFSRNHNLIFSDLDITKVVLSLSRLNFSRDLDITKVVLSLSRHNESCGSQRKNRFLTT